MKQVLAVGALVLLVAVAWWWWRSGDRAPARVVAAADAAAVAAPVASPELAPAVARGEVAVDAGRRAAAVAPAARARTDALRQQIVQRVGPRAAPSAAASPGAPAERPPGNLVDRTGGGPKRKEMLARLNQDFMPLADECIELAQERTPELAGMLAIDLELVADADLGAVVEVADPSARNEVADPELLECIRESALSLSLPPPDGSGRDAVMLTLPISPR